LPPVSQPAANFCFGQKLQQLGTPGVRDHSENRHPRHPSTPGRGVDGMVVVHSAYPRTTRQKPTSTVLRVRRDRELDLLRAGAICGGSMLSGDD